MQLSKIKTTLKLTYHTQIILDKYVIFSSVLLWLLHTDDNEHVKDRATLRVNGLKLQQNRIMRNPIV